MITIFKDIKTTNNPYYVNLQTIYQRITEGKSKHLIDQIRTLKEKKDRNAIKMQLPSICFSGEFTKRANNAITKHSGIVCLDFDHLDNVELFKEKVSKDKFTLMAFVSPSGDGLKVLIKIPASIRNHAASCRALKHYYKTQKLDSFEDVARVCYESYDKSAYFNSKSAIFTDLITIKETKVQRKEVNNDSYEIFENLKKWIENSETYGDGNKHTFLVKFAGALNRFGVNQYDSERMLINAYQHRASYVSSDDISKIVIKCYNKYSNQHNISYFETNKSAVERTTKKQVSGDFFNDYQEINKFQKFEKIFDDRLINLNKKYERPPSILSIHDDWGNECKIMSLGNLSTISGKQKSKKTFLHSIFAGCLLWNNYDFDLFPQLIANLQEGKDGVLLFDTEQSEYDAFTVANRIKNISKTDADKFGCFGLRGMESKEIMTFIEYLLVEKFKDQIAVIFIDQIADLVSSLNDEKECVKVVRFLENLSREQNIHICNIVHQNKHTEFAQGWLGTQLMKKSETVISIMKDPEEKSTSHVKATDVRGTREFEDFSIYINQQGMPEVLNKDNGKVNI